MDNSPGTSLVELRIGVDIQEVTTTEFERRATLSRVFQMTEGSILVPALDKPAESVRFGFVVP